ncbi:MAG: glycerate kinase type-2 family protein [Dehalococcoidia bacterium]
MIIKNREELISSSLRARAVELIEAGITRVLPANLLKAAVRYNHDKKMLRVMGESYDLSRGRIFIVGGGKASGLMAEEMERIIGPSDITAGIVNCNSSGYETKKIEVRQAGHPLPDEAGIHGVWDMLAMKARHSIGRGDLVICLISGGGSALLPCPASGITLQGQQEITRLLLRSGANIKEINIVRKHLSLIKGGQLGAFYEPAKIVSLIISDVVGDDLNTIASGPTVPDPSTFCEAQAVLKKYGLITKAPKNVVDFIKRGTEGLEAETPKETCNCDNYIIGNNSMCLEAMAEKARDLGLRPNIVTAELSGDTAGMAFEMAGEIAANKYKGFDVILLGGETTPTLPENSGQGGRNQHYAAVSMLAMNKLLSSWLVASVGTDGSDYLPEVAGAMVDDRSLATATAAKIDVDDYIARFDSYTLFRKMRRSLIITGSTGTNVSDVIMYLLG